MKTVNSRRAGAAQKLLSRETVRTHLGASGPYGSRAGGSEPSDLLRGVEQLEKQLGKENGEPRELSRCEEAAPSPKRAALSERNPSASQAQMPARAAARAFEGRDQGALRRLGETLDGAALGDVLHGAPADVVGEAVGSLGTAQQVEVMRQCVQRLPADGEALLPILDALGARIFVGRDASMVRVEDFTSNDDIKQANFVRSMLEAVASGRMPLFTMTTWAFFYGARPFDDEHWGKSSSTFSWTLEGGWYKEALRTLMYVGNERTLKMMHGPGFSGKVLAADVPKGVYRYSDLDEAQLRADCALCAVGSQPTPAAGASSAGGGADGHGVRIAAAPLGAGARACHRGHRACAGGARGRAGCGAAGDPPRGSTGHGGRPPGL